MNKSEKKQLIDQLTEQFNNYSFFYFTDDSSLNVASISKLRRMCFEKGIPYKVAKNTLIIKAMEASNKDASEMFATLKGSTAIMYSETANAPAKLLKEFRKNGSDRPILKSAFLDSEIYIGDAQLAVLASLKSRNEMIGDIVGLLLSPIQNVIGALQNKDAAAGKEEATPEVEAIAETKETVAEVIEITETPETPGTPEAPAPSTEETTDNTN